MDKLTSEQLSEWEAYDKLDPIGKWRDEYMIANLCSLILNVANSIHAKKGHTPKRVDPIDFMPDWLGERKEKEEEKQSLEEMKSFLLGFVTKHNKKIKR